MGTTSAGKFPCDACGKSYSWKAELAGRRVKCKCGHVMTCPKEDPATVPVAVDDAPPPGFDDLYELAQGTPKDEAYTPPPIKGAGGTCPNCGSGVDAGAVLCVNCGTNLKTGKKLKTQKAGGGGGGGGGGGTPVLAGVGAGGGGAVAMLGYAPSRKRLEQGERGGDVFFHPVKDLYIPAGLVVLGTVLTYLGIVYNKGITSPGYAMLALGLVCFVSVVLTIPGILITIRLFDLGLGPIGPGILKLAACAILPGGIGEMFKLISSGPMSGYFGWCASLVLTVIIFMKLLDMDYFETMVCSTIIWVIQTWLSYALVFALLNGLGVPVSPLAGAFGGGGGGGRITLAGDAYDADRDDPALDRQHAREADEQTTYELQGGGVDGKKWIDEKPDRVLAGQTRAKSERIINEFYNTGIAEVRVFPTKHGGVEQVVRMIVVNKEDKKPETLAARAKAWALMEPLAKQLNRVKPRDRGLKYWPIQMLTDEEIRKLEPQTFDAGPKASDGKGDDGEE